MKQETTLGMDESIEALLCYSFGWVTGIIFLVMEKNSLFVRFHAMQSLVTFLGLSIIMVVLGTILPYFGFVIASFLWLAGVVLWIILMLKAYKGEWFRLPVIGDFAYNFVEKGPGATTDSHQGYAQPGTPFEPKDGIIFCRQCGAQAKGDARFCEQCGTLLKKE
ncbi:MAG: hypothetical protein C0392_02350 [Syntrophus sp. (in: bacteria)]|nr:hypothetical protein [Syntrophus sp. (in: bacteria)]